MWQLGAARIATSNDDGHDRHKYRDHSEAFPAPARNFSVPQVNQRRSAQSRQSFKMLSPDGPLRQRNHFKSFCRHISLYESLRVSMREQQRRNWRHGSAAESGVGSACRPPQRSGRTVRKSAVSVKVSADGPGLLTLAVPGNQKTARGGLGGDFYAPPAHGLGRCRADRNPRVGKRVKGGGPLDPHPFSSKGVLDFCQD